MTASDPQPEFKLTEADKAEVQQLAERSRSMSRRGFFAASGKVLAFTLPAIATFTVSPDALGATGSGTRREKLGGRAGRPAPTTVPGP